MSELNNNADKNMERRITRKNTLSGGQRDNKNANSLKDDDLKSLSSLKSIGGSSRSNSSGKGSLMKRRKKTKCQRRIEKMQKKILSFLESNYTVAFMTIITVWVLFADDIRQIATNKYGDIYFYDINFACLICFALELLLLCLAKPGYFLSFFFWLDLISTFSLVFDIGWISDNIFGTSSGGGTSATQHLAKAGQASRVGTRAGRIVRIVRLVRLIRIVKLYKHAQQAMLNKENLIIEGFEDNLIGESPSSNAANEGQSPQQIALGDEKTPMNAKNQTRNNNKTSKSINRIIGDQSAKPSLIAETNSSKQSNCVDAKDDQENKLDNAKTPSDFNKNKDDVNKAKAEEKKNEEDDDNIQIPKEMNVGKKLSELTMKRVIMLVMSVMISIPLFTVDTYVTDYSTGQSGLDALSMYYFWNNTSAAFNISLATYTSYHRNLRNPLLIVNIDGNQSEWDNGGRTEDDYRDNDKQYYVYTNSSGVISAYSAFDLEYDNMVDAALGMVRTVFVSVVLALSALYFSKDANDLVLLPIENMLEKVNRIAKNPLEAAQIEENEALALELLEKKGDQKALDLKKENGTYETAILEKTIIKIGALLALGFGEAGSEIIAQNMAKSGDVDPMIPGKKVMAIFGFCDIRNFTDATEVLQEGVMVFVNEIAEIVHGTVDYFSGAANKNIGDAFLLVWKFPKDQVIVQNQVGNILKLNDSHVVHQIADMALLSFLKIIASINRSKKLEKYRHNPGLNARMPNYSVKMGFGLHVGWAIEGAIGSEYKIDASYLSPNVNMASRLEAATKQFGVPLLISGALYKILTEETKKHVRIIDRVTVKGSTEPIELCTCDVDYSRVAINQKAIDLSTLSRKDKKKYKVLSRIRRNELREKVLQGKFNVSQLFSSDTDLVTMREPFTEAFYTLFNEGLQHYFAGNWPKAKEILEKTYVMIPGHKDGPSNTLLSVLKEYGYKAPPAWKGYRELTEK